MRTPALLLARAAETLGRLTRRKRRRSFRSGIDKVIAILQALAPYAWPLVALIFLLVLHRRYGEHLKRLFQTAEGRKFSFKLGGIELTMEEATRQQLVLITDLQEKLEAIEGRLKNTPSDIAGETKLLTEGKNARLKIL